jgi:hypothetical protein
MGRKHPGRVLTEDELLDLADRVVAALRKEGRRPPRAVIFETLRAYFQERATLMAVGGPATVGHRLRALAVLPVVRQVRQELFGTEDPPFRTWPEARRWLLQQGGEAVVRVLSEDLQGTEQVQVPWAFRQVVNRVAGLTGWSEAVAAAHLLCGWQPAGAWRATWRNRTELFSVPTGASLAFLAMPYCQLTLYPEALSQQAWAQLRLELLDRLKKKALKDGLVEHDDQVVQLRPPVFTKPEEDLLGQVLKTGRLPPRPGRGRPAGAAEYWARVARACEQATGRPVAPAALRMRWLRLARRMPWLEALLKDALAP